MARALLIAEKPDLMRKVKAVYDKIGFKDRIDFASFRGHTMALFSPEDYKPEWKKWNLSDLPLIPEKFKYKPIDDKKALYKDLKGMIEKGGYDYLINCCDPGREGQSIFFTFYDTIGCKIPVKRMWHSDLTDKELKRSLENLRDENEPSLKNMTYASKLRGYFDWEVGMNFSRAFSVISGVKTNLGRVMTPTLKIIVDRELEIRNFKPQTFYEIEGDFGDYKGVYFYEKDGEVLTKFTDKSKASSVKFGDKGIIESLEQKKETKYAPNLHALSDLQIECSKVYGYTPADTLKIAQSLYEKQILSYPRTDSPYLTKATALDTVKGFKSILSNSIASVPELAKYSLAFATDTKLIDTLANNKKYVDDKKVSDHYAIIPTGEKVDFSKLSKEERNVFLLVSKRVLSLFMKPVIANKTVLITNVDGNKFKTNGSIIVEKGYSELYKTSFSENTLPPLKKGDSVTLKGTNLLEKTTTAPSRYTDATLLGAMKNPAKFVEDTSIKNTLKEAKGIGTEATRASILEKLVSIKMMERKKKNVIPTEYGISVIQNLGDNKIASPELTGIWEEKLKEIEACKLNPRVFYDEMLKYIKDEIALMLKQTITIEGATPKGGVVGKCPKCGKIVKETKLYYLCEGYKDTCNFAVGKTICGATVGKADIKKIIEGSETKKMKFKKDSKTWETSLVYDKSQEKVVFGSFQNGGKAKLSDLKCPCCSKPLKITGKYYVCSEYKNTCNCCLGVEFFGAKITEEDMKQLLSGATLSKTFTWKSGKFGMAKMNLQDGKYKLIF